MSLLGDLFVDPVTSGGHTSKPSNRGHGDRLNGSDVWRNVLPIAAGSAVAAVGLRVGLDGLAVPDHPSGGWAAAEAASRWPALAAGAGASMAAAGAVGWAEYHSRRLSSRRRRLLFARRWSSAWPGRAPRLRGLRVQDGAVAATVTKPRDTSWEKVAEQLDVEKGLVPAKLRLDRRFGAPERVELQQAEANASTTRRLLAVYRPLPMPEQMAPWFQPADASKLVVGVGYSGPVSIDLDQRPHLRVLGPSGYGKGFAIRLIETQALLSGWLLVMVDGGGSPEHAVLDAAPTVLRPKLVMSNPEPGLAQIVATLNMLLALADHRSKLCDRFKVDNWASLPEVVRAEQPRVLCIVDELTALLGAASKKDPVGQLRAEVGALLDKIIRAVRKFGIHLALADQISYAGTVSKGTQGQAPAYLLLGPVFDSQARMVAGRSNLPAVVDHFGCGVAGIVGGWAQEVRVPPNDRDTVAQAVARVTDNLNDQENVK